MSKGATMRLKGKVAIVTGGGAGIGRAVSEIFGREGASVVVAEIDPSRGEEVVGMIRRSGAEAAFVRVDVSKTADVKAMAAEAVQRYGGVDILFNNAAIQLHGQDARAHELSEDAWDRTMLVNLRGVWLCSKYTIPAMLKRNGGSIIHGGSPT